MMVAQLEEEVGMGREGLVILMNVRNLGYCQFCQRLCNSVLLYDRKTLRVYIHIFFIQILLLMDS